MKRFLFVILILLVGCAPSSLETIIINDISIEVEIADSVEEQTKGLMYREHLAEHAGMLFVFDQESRKSFWMKNTLIPLDMIHITNEGIIVDIMTAQPCTADPCKTYPSVYPAQYVLEVNAGFAEKNNIHIGDRTSLGPNFKT